MPTQLYWRLRTDCCGLFFCNYAWPATFNAAADTANQTLVVTLILRLIPGLGQPTDLLDDAPIQAKLEIHRSAIETTWSEKFSLVPADPSQATFKVKVKVIYLWPTDVGLGHFNVFVYQGLGQSGVYLGQISEWYVDKPTDPQHEAGHMFGCRDEYPDPKCPNRPELTDVNSIMALGDQIRKRHYWYFANALSLLTGADYSAS